MNIFDTLINASEVIIKDIGLMHIEMIIIAIIISAISFYISKWFRAYILRLIIFILGVSLTLDVLQRENILFSVDFYVGVGMFIPHIEIVEITYLILKERTLYVYNRLLALVLFLLSPFIWIYRQVVKIFMFIKVKREHSKNEKAYNTHYKQEYQEQKSEKKEYKQEKQHYQKQEQSSKKEKRQEQKKEETKQTYSRWDDTDPYKVLGLQPNATKKEIKKAYKNLSKIYHPDLTLTKKDEHLVIFQKINNAYMKLS